MSSFSRSDSLSTVPCLGPVSSSPLTGFDEQIVFYNSEYEQELLSQYFGESAPVDTSVPSRADTMFESSDPLDWIEDSYLPLTFEDVVNPLPAIDFFDAVPTEQEPARLPSPAPTFSEDRYSGESNTSGVSKQPRASPYHRPIKTEPMPTAPSRRGRPMKMGSDSKMANYARSYREMKKSQLHHSEHRVAELQEENRKLSEENQRIAASFRRLEQEIADLRAAVLKEPRLSSSMPHNQQFAVVKKEYEFEGFFLESEY